jgi:protein-tyrosine-phosphatase/predicted ATP-grasp superfamily ATP-dependent carboligase
MMTAGKAALVLDGDMPHSLAIVRSLARRGLAVDLASHVDKPIAGYSRRLRRLLRCPNPLADAAGFLDWLRTATAGDAYCFVIPVTERTVVALLGTEFVQRRDVFALAPPAAMAVALDKGRTAELAASLGIPVPFEARVRDESELAAAMAGISYPAVLKPASSIGQGTGQRRQLSVAYAFGEPELRAKAREFLAWGDLLLQAYVRGEGVGIELIADHGRIVFAFQHRRLHEVPLTGGGSSLRVSVPIEPALLEASQRLMSALAWHGVAMIEFKWSPEDGSFTLMEINGRFWGSLPLAIAAGADFPAMLYELVVEGAVQPRPAARTGIYCRKLAADVHWLEQVVRREAPPDLVAYPSLGKVMRDAALALSPRHYFDIQDWRDPWPGLVDGGRIVAGYADRLLQRWRERRQLRRHRLAWRRGSVATRLAGARQVLFVCYGNINRSALAERAFHQLAPDAGVAAISAGFHEEEGRPADPVMVEVARQAGIDLGQWASHKLTPDMVRASEVILVMEHSHYERLLVTYPEAAGKTFLLGMAGSGSACARGEIADPFGGPRCVYQRCATDVVGSVRRLLEMLPATTASSR